MSQIKDMVTEEKIKEALFSIGGLKAPRPNEILLPSSKSFGILAVRI